jgi:hypothetical protein
MATVLEKNITEEQRSVVRFLWAKKSSMQRIFKKKYFLFLLGSVCRITLFQLDGKCFADEKEVETEVRK